MSARLDAVVHAIGPAMLRPAAMPRPAADVTTATFVPPDGAEPGSVVLAVGLRADGGAVPGWVMAAAANGVAALVVRATASLPPAVVDTAGHRGVGLLLVAPNVGWADLRTALVAAIGVSETGRPLSDIAAGAAAAIGAPVVIEDGRPYPAGRGVPIEVDGRVVGRIVADCQPTPSVVAVLRRAAHAAAVHLAPVESHPLLHEDPGEQQAVIAFRHTCLSDVRAVVGSQAVAVGSTVYAVARAAEAGRVAADVMAFAGGSAHAGVGRSRREADQAATAVAEQPALGPVAHIAGVRTQVFLGHVDRWLAGRPERGAGRVAALLEHDERNGTDYAASLLAHVRSLGDAAEAAAAVHVHRKSLRYRLRRVVELSGLDLSDPGERLVAWLDLRAHR